MTTDYLVRPVQKEDTREILALIESCLGSSIIPRTPEFWEWKHFRNPFGVSPGLVAEAGGKIIALRIFMRWSWNSAGRSLSAVRAVDTVTHPDWRGKGIFLHLTKRLVQSCEDSGVSFIFNTPNRSSMPGYIKMGWQQVAKVPLRFRMLRLLPGFKTIKPATERPDDTNLKDTLAEFEMLPLFQEHAADPRLHTSRTKEYLLWRYADIPGISYRCKYRRGGDASAIVIYRTRMRNRFKELSVSELLHSPGEGVHCAAELLNELAKESSADYAVAIAARASCEQAALSEASFYGLPIGGPPMTVRLLGHQEVQPSPLQWSSWRCSIGDLELF